MPDSKGFLTAEEIVRMRDATKSDCDVSNCFGNGYITVWAPGFISNAAVPCPKGCKNHLLDTEITGNTREFPSPVNTKIPWASDAESGGGHDG